VCHSPSVLLLSCATGILPVRSGKGPTSGQNVNERPSIAPKQLRASGPVLQTGRVPTSHWRHASGTQSRLLVRVPLASCQWKQRKSPLRTTRRPGLKRGPEAASGPRQNPTPGRVPTSHWRHASGTQKSSSLSNGPRKQQTKHDDRCDHNRKARPAEQRAERDDRPAVDGQQLKVEQ
jgi:hypothetical protein